MKKSISVVFALSFLISFPVSALGNPYRFPVRALEEPYRRRCSMWINGSRAYVLSCIGSRDERGRANYIEWHPEFHPDREYRGYFDGYVSTHPRHDPIGVVPNGPWRYGRTKDCFVNVIPPNEAICLYD